MKPIIVYEALDPTVPQNLRFVGRFRDGGRLLPLTVSGPSEEYVRNALVEWWNLEEARQEKVGLKRPKPKPETLGSMLGLLPS